MNIEEYRKSFRFDDEQYAYELFIKIDGEFVCIDNIASLVISADGRSSLGLFALGYHNAKIGKEGEINEKKTHDKK